MIKVLKERFGEANQSDKYRFELKSRRRRPNETFRSLYSDIRRLTALALPDLEHRARETMACDYFIDALNDPNSLSKFASRFPKDLDTALRVTLQLEVWSKDVDQSTRRERRTREIAEPEKKYEQTDMFKKQVAKLQKQLAELQKKDQTATLTKRVAELEARLTEAKSSAATVPAAFNIALPRATTGATGPRSTEIIPPRKGTCWGCRDPRHRLWAYPELSNTEKRELYCRKIRRIGVQSRPMCIVVRNSGKRHTNADGLSRRARPPAARHEGAVESANQSTNSEQLNAACYTDTEPDEVMDSEQCELEEEIPSARPVHAPDKEPAETEAEPSVSESLAPVSNPILSWESSSDCAASLPSNRRLLFCQLSQRALIDCIINGSA